MAPEAEQDLDEAYAWYEKQRVGLGEEFLTSVDACIEFICRFPDTGSIVFETFPFFGQTFSLRRSVRTCRWESNRLWRDAHRT